MANTNDIYELDHVMRQNNAVLTYVGNFSQDTVKTMLKYIESKLETSGIKDIVRKKIFNVMTEMLQNITKHQRSADENDPAVFIMGETLGGFYLLTGNTIDDSSIEIVNLKIGKINSMNKEELKEYYKKARLDSTISEVGGAGLGFIDIVRKSENPIDYKFIRQANGNSFFVLKATINNNEI